MKVAMLVFALALVQQSSATSSIEGVVVKSGTSDSVARAVVEMSKEGETNGRPAEPQTRVTSADGRFSFRDLVPGSYSITVSRNGYIGGQRREVLVERGKPKRDLRVPLTPTGAISGRVFDNSGEPVANVSVQALKYSWSEGEATLTSVKASETNDRGEFRLFWLPPGRYLLNANPNVAGLGSFFIHTGISLSVDGATLNKGSGERRGEEQLAPVYYPGTADPQGASALDVGPGADITGIDFVLVRAVTRRIRGVAIDSVTGMPISAVSFLVPRNGSEIGQFALPSAAFNNDGFEVRDVLPGAYFLVATARTGGGGRGSTRDPNEVRVMGGRVAVDVAEKDVDGVRVLLSPGVDISGRVTIDGGVVPNPTQYGLRHPAVSLRDNMKGVAGRSQMYVGFSDDQSFTISNVLEGEYRVQVTNLPPGTYVESVRFGAANAVNDTIRVDPRTREQLEIVLGANGGVMEGMVLVGSGASREALPGATVAVIPAGDGLHRQDLFRSIRADATGRFHMDGIAPGNYLVFAWEEMDDALWRDPDFVRRNERLARNVRIVESRTETLELSAIPQ